MKLPRDLAGTVLAKHLCKQWDYSVVHQVGSHMILQTEDPTHQRLPIPAHGFLRIGTLKAVISGKPEVKHISTSLTERNNLTMRMSMRRFTRLINAFSKKLENYEHAIALHFMHYNFCRIHQTIRVTPAMEAGVSERVCKIPDIVDLLES